MQKIFKLYREVMRSIDINIIFQITKPLNESL